ncbi:AEC family transporter [Auritidibacter sp. NML120636]|uniref:AEC family transporter n=1 Tax=Auritidibacter sp. NML120636 TaxID=2170743 RepID=UPI000D73D8F9|nr:AEC family transporter [Auritidibacter sp. NML120636]PXA81081.1 hypothetical protein DCC25_04375 [Auritidibacter sp. NML120636]
MAEVISGFTVIWVIILVGYLVGKTRVLGPQAQQVLSRTAFFVANPALLFKTLSESDISVILGPQLWVAAISAFTILVIYLVISRFVIPAGTWSERFMGGMSSSMVNSANLGIPISAYVLGNPAWSAPVILFQLAIYTPIYVLVLDTLTDREQRTDRSSTAPRKVRPTGFLTVMARMLVSIVKNPMIIGSGLGIISALTDIHFPGPIDESITLIAGASIPAMLLAFGLSLVGSKPLEKDSRRRSAVLIGSALKLVLHPALAWVLAQFVFGMDPVHVFTAVVLASLPTAQNVFVAASRYNTGIVVSRDTVFITTIAAIPATILIAVLLA